MGPRKALSKLEKLLHLQPISCDQPTRVIYKPQFGCSSFSNRARWATICLVVLLSGLLSPSLALRGTRMDYMAVMYIRLGLPCAGGVAVAILFSMLLCGEHRTSFEWARIHDTDPSRCSWGCGFFRFDNFSTRLRWCIAVPIIVGSFVLQHHKKICSDRHTARDCKTTLVVFLPLDLVGLCLLATMCCCTERSLYNQEVRQQLVPVHVFGANERLDDSKAMCTGDCSF
jgi:hypothetical protein